VVAVPGYACYCSGCMSDSIHAKLIEIEAALADDRLSEADRFLLTRTQQALRATLQWPAATGTFDRSDASSIGSECKRH
jgi:hypothetical protein